MLGSTTRVWVASIVVFTLIANFAVAAFVLHEKTVYSRDSRAYWHRAQLATGAVQRLLHIDGADLASPGAGNDPSQNRNRDQGPGLDRSQESQSPSLARYLERVLRSIWSDDYNLVAVLPLLPWTVVFGADRLSFVLATLNIYAIPAAILLCLFCVRSATAIGLRAGPWSIWVPLAVILGFPLFWAPIVRGMVDVGILAFNVAVLLIYFWRRPGELGWRALIAIGLLLSLSVIFRRWNAYWVVSFLVVIGLEGLIAFAASAERTPANLFRHLRPALVAGASTLVVMAAVAGPFVLKAATTDYGDVYEAYRWHDSLAEGLWISGREVGFLWVLIFALAAALLLRAPESRRLSLLLTGQLAIIVVLFLRTQSFGIHHYYLWQAGLLIMSSLLILDLLQRLSGWRSKATVVATMLGLAVVANLAVFTPSAAPLHAWLQPLLPSDTYYPLVREDVAELNRLYAKLDEIISTAGPQAKFYVLSASAELNDTHFIWTSLTPPFSFKSSERLLRLQFVDKRDGFPQHLLEADIVILGAPIGGRSDGYEVMREPAHLIGDQVGLGRAFEALPEVFQLEHGVTARIFKKVRPITEAEIRGLSDHLRQHYPDRPYVFDPGQQ